VLGELKMDKSAVILAFNESKEDKGLKDVNGKAFVRVVVDNVRGYVDEAVIVVDSQERADLYGKLVLPNVRFAVDPQKLKNPLAAALAGFKAALGDYCLLLPLATPLIPKEIGLLLFECGVGKSATVPRTPDRECDTLEAVYKRSTAIEEAEKALADGVSDLAVMVERMRGVRYISTLVFEQLNQTPASTGKKPKKDLGNQRKGKPKKR
jgi:molybdopterin-guanine dinucleotide biosynthesis protein A